MSLKTINFGLIKPDLNDPADITAFNQNWDKIDEQLLKAGETGGSDLAQTELASDVDGNNPFVDPVVENTMAKIADDVIRPHIENKSNPHNVTAKQIGALTSNDIIDNLRSTNTDKALSAKQGKVLLDKMEQIRYIDKITLASSKFRIDSQELIHRADGFVYIRFSGVTLEDLSAGESIILGYVDKEFVDYYCHPAIAVPGITVSSSDVTDMRVTLYGTSSVDGFEQQVRGKTTAKIGKGSHIYITLYYYLNK
jgi:hypothetical protein